MAAKTCPICGNRPAYTGTSAKITIDEAPRLSEMCNFCYTESGWENAHSDYDHEGNSATSEDDEKARCWICHPELNLATKPRSERVGTSRAGMRLTVSIRAAAKTKAQEVKSQLPDGYKVTIRTDKDGTTRLTAKGAITIHLVWDGNAFASGTVQAVNGTARKVRNASEALRHAGA